MVHFENKDAELTLKILTEVQRLFPGFQYVTIDQLLLRIRHYIALSDETSDEEWGETHG